ncbi:MAG: putative spermidine/putrescine transport system permease protein [Actinomycetota bacterium]|nr:putative spermidine/putrescine transport system permease protein [Actinomycetota bacterium]
MTVEAPNRPPSKGAGSRISALLWRRPWLRAGALLAPPLGWFIFVYLAALAVLLITAFWQINPFTTAIERIWSFSNFKTLLSNPAYRAIALRTVRMAAAVTITDALLAFPVAYFMAKIAAPRTQKILFGAILLPLWASYIARVYAWQLIFTHDGVLNWSLGKLGLPAINIAYTNWAMWIVFCYIWLPFMIIPIYSALERVPTSLIEASADLGGRGWRTLRRVILPLALPGIAAGSIFTFSLTLGDYITALLVGGAGGKLIGNVVYDSVGVSNNVPFAAAFALFPVVIMAVYLFGARRLGAFEAL